MASDTKLPELVRDSRLEATFHGPDQTIHTILSSRRTKSPHQVWNRVKILGSGGYGIIWLEHGQDQGNVKAPSVRAVKELRTHRKLDNGADYVRELEALAKFSQRKFRDYFVRSYGWYEKPEALCIALEYCEHGDLRNFIRNHGALPEKQAQDIARQVTEGLLHMHTNGFAHRDLNPANILIRTCPPEEWWVKIADLGLSKRVGEDAVSTTVRGTPGFIPPELLSKEGRRADPVCVDIWCLGEITVHMLTGKATFADQVELFRYQQDPGIIPPTFTLISRTKNLAYGFIRSCMAAQPRERWSAEQAIQHKWLSDNTAISDPLTAIWNTEMEKMPKPGEVYHFRSNVSPVHDTITLPSGTWNTIPTHALEAEKQRESTMHSRLSRNLRSGSSQTENGNNSHLHRRPTEGLPRPMQEENSPTSEKEKRTLLGDSSVTINCGEQFAYARTSHDHNLHLQRPTPVQTASKLDIPVRATRHSTIQDPPMAQASRGLDISTPHSEARWGTNPLPSLPRSRSPLRPIPNKQPKVEMINPRREAVSHRAPITNPLLGLPYSLSTPSLIPNKPLKVEAINPRKKVVSHRAPEAGQEVKRYSLRRSKSFQVEREPNPKEKAQKPRSRSLKATRGASSVGLPQSAPNQSHSSLNQAYTYQNPWHSSILPWQGGTRGIYWQYSLPQLTAENLALMDGMIDYYEPERGFDCHTVVPKGFRAGID
ncbi:kinase-like domain-containing protein [Xylariaceae sp. AK1471]|nr:kinase-like domain-containing protein [Xylariaceae sp. AK1471]